MRDVNPKSMNNFRVLLASLCLSALILNGSAHAAPKFQSADFIAFQEAKAKALIEGKKIMLIASAAWCGPCAELEEILKIDRAKLSPELDQYLIFDTEQTWSEMSYMTDLLPSENFGFPGVRLIDPATDRYTAIGITSFFLPNFPLVKTLLAEFSAGRSVHDLLVAQYQDALKAGKSFSYMNPTSSYDILDHLLMTGSYEPSFEKSGAFWKMLRDDAAAHPSQFQFDARYGIKEMLERSEVQLLSRGGHTLDELRALDPGAFLNTSPDSSYLDYLNFLVPIRESWYVGDYAQATKICREQAPKRYTAALQWKAEIICKELAVLDGSMSADDVETYMNGLTAQEREKGYDYLVSLAVLAGRIDLAEKQQLVNYAVMLKKYGGDPTLKARIEKANAERLAAFTQKKRHP